MSYVEKLAKSIEQIAKSIEQRIKASMHKTNWYAFCSCFYTIKRSKFMKKYWNPKSRMIHNPACLSLRSLLYALCYQLGLNSFKLLALSSVLSALLIFCWLLYPERASSGPYLDSAHGSSSYGVKRSATGFPTDYGQGNCAHCHEQHASIGGSEPVPNTGDAAGPDKFCLLANNFDTTATIKPYSKDDNVCFYCHVDTVTGTLQTPSFNNYIYCVTFGGYSSYTANVDDNIFGTFNNTSYHNLNDILNFAKATWSSTFTANSNPCNACHNVHIAKRSCGKPPLTNTYDPAKSAISKPSDHSNLWGDDTSERINPNFTTSYQSPYWYGSTNYEPNNSTTYDGTNLPDYNTFCTDCHNATNTISSTVLGTLKKIDWATTGGDSAGGDKHGKNVATTNICVDPPYNSTSSCTTTGLGKVLSCLDCHEPHGAPNIMLIRKEVNGDKLNNGTSSVIVSTGIKDYGYLCRQCHMDDLNYDSTHGVANRWEAIHHCAGDYPYDESSCGGCHGSGGGKFVCGGGGGGGGNPPPAIRCSDCHFHGSIRTDANYAPTTRRTF